MAALKTEINIEQKDKENGDTERADAIVDENTPTTDEAAKKKKKKKKKNKTGERMLPNKK